MPVGTELFNVSCTYSGTIQYEILTFTPEVVFISIGSISGLVTLEIDALSLSTTIRDYTASMRCFDPGDTTQRSISIITVTRIDENEYQPAWQHEEPAEVFVSEAHALNVIVDLDATDDDLGIPGDIVYGFRGTLPDPFSINPTTGEVSLTMSLDYDTRASYQFIATASNPPDPAVDLLVVIRVTDINDEPPAFLQSTYQHSVQETFHVPRPAYGFFSISCTDIDSNETDISYAIVSGEDTGPFAIDSITGAFSATQDLDSDMAPSSYSFQAVCFDNGSPNLTSQPTRIDLTILPVNEFVPNIVQAGLGFSTTTESQQSNSVLLPGPIEVIDGDSGPDGMVTYSLNTVGTNGTDLGTFLTFLNVDEMNGDLIVLQDIDVDILVDPTLIFQVKITACDTDPPRDICPNFVRFIFVISENDNDPMFSQLDYDVIVSEIVLVDTVIIQASCTDIDRGTGAFLGISFSNPTQTVQNTFSIDSETGDITVASSLDYEQVTSYAFELRCEDNGGKRHNALVSINVMAVNDNDPEFISPSFVFSVSQTAPSDRFLIGSVLASDLDVDEGGDLRYYFTIENSFFRITDTGFIELFDSLVNFSDPTVSLQVEVTDGYTIDEANVTIHVTEGNFNQPRFVTMGNVASISELTPIGNVVISVLCTDGDTGSNAEITYSIEEGDIGELFSINRSVGSIAVANSLVLPQNDTGVRYELLVRCSDGGVPVFSHETLVSISIFQEDDSVAPSIANDTIHAFVSEDAAINHTVVVITSESIGSASLRYTIEEASVPNVFQIDPSTGRVSVVAALDRENVDMYQMTVVVSELRNPGDFRPIRTDNATLFIFLRDVNDNTPTCLSQAAVTIAESLPLASLVTQLNCSDRDIGENGDILYSLVDDYGILEVTSQGQLVLNGSLTSTDSNVLVIEVIVTDRGSPSRMNIYPITVFISSSNSFAPSFTNLPETISLPESQPTQSLVFTVGATDPDRGSFGQISYSIVNSEENDAFTIVPNTGMVLLNMQLSHFRRSMYNLSVSASDGDHTTVEVLTIIILDENNFAPECQSLAFYTTSENLEPPHLIGTFPCSDGDEGSNGEIVISILDGNFGNIFYIQPNGSIIANQSLDFEQRGSYFLILRVTDRGSPPLAISNTLLAIIIVESVNEFPPSFEAEEFVAQVDEHASVGSAIISVVATDGDSNLGADGIVEYTIVSDVQVPFSISDSGVLQVAGDIDREAQEMYTFNIQASDQAAVSPMSDNATVVIIVNDVDDNPPLFSAISYFAVLNESTADSGPILVLECTDRDLGSNAALSYFLGSSQEAMLFEVNSSSGSIDVSDDLPLSGTYTFEAICTGLGPTNFSDTATVSIQAFVESNITFHPSSSYLVVVDEDVQPVRDILQVTASSSSGTSLSYALVNEDTPFGIEMETGTIRLLSSLDYEIVRSYALQVLALDSGTPPSTGSALVRVDVGNINDNTPRITTVPSVIFQSEGSINATVPLGEFDCSDDDGGVLGSVIFRLETLNGENLFGISETGSLQLIQGLDYETAQMHDIILVCQDGGMPPLSDSVTVSVQVSPVNDNPPVFPPNLIILVEERIQLGENVGPQIQATDADLSPHNDLRYSIVSGDPNNTFIIVPTTGQLVLLSTLDYETVQSYDLVIEANDGGALLNNEYIVLSSLTTVEIVVLDFNDNRPILSSSLYLGDISENAALGDAVALMNDQQISCSDLDSQENGEVSLHIVSGNVNNTFSIDDRGLVMLQGMLNIDAMRTYQMVIECRDNGEPQRSTEATLIVNVVGLNEFVPEFTSPTYNFQVIENAPMGTEIGTISVGSRDGEGGIVYTFVNGTVSVFILDPNTGTIVIASPLDYETQDRLYIIGAVATDLVDSSGYTTVIINLVNEDDNLPIFSSSSYFASILEHTAAGHAVTRVSCTDADDAADRIRVRYSIETVSPFSILDGTILVDGVLDLETVPRYSLDISCTDSGRNTVRATVSIDLEPLNDFPPVFIDAPYTKEIAENPEIGTPVITVVATDDDTIQYNDIAFTFVSGNEAGRFTLDRTSGTITTASELDREVQEQYVFVIQAANNIPPDDTSGSEALSSQTTLVVIVTDINDNKPVITVGQSNVFIPEGNSSGVVVTQFICTDADSGNNGATAFSFANFALSNQFEILDDGTLVTIDSLSGNVLVEIVCADGGFPRQVATATVIVETVSMNNHVPAFDQRFYNVTVDESQAIGVNITCFTATDMDGSNTADGILLYSLSAISVPNGANSFSIGRETGCLFATQSLSPNEVFSYDIVATDQGEQPLSGTAFLVVIVLDVFQDPPVFEGSPYTRFLSEVSESGAFIANTFCHDPNAADSVSYSIIGGNDQDLFSIGELNGTIVLGPGRRLDYETTIYHTLTVQCIDNNNLTDVATVFVTVTPVNEFTPSFQPVETFTIPEHSIQGTAAARLSWTDQDAGPDGEVSFSIISGNENGEFLVTDDGRVLVSGVLDREVLDSYRLEIEIRDHSTQSRASTNHIEITVTDINDQPPIFSADPYLFGPLQGNEVLGQYIDSINCSDQDLGENAQVSYHLLAGSNEELFFSVDLNSGNITLANNLDLRTMDRIGFIVECRDMGSRQMTGISQVIVTVEEFNAFPPEFFNSSYYTEVAENASIGDTLITVFADDRDSGVSGQITYYLAGDAELPFEINDRTGDIYLLTSLDFESDTEFRFAVEASDGAPDSEMRHTASVNVTIGVLGINEHTPVCMNTNFYVIINASTQGEILSLNCYDEDSGLDGLLLYSLSDDNTLFEVSTEGVVLIPSPIIATEGTEQYKLQLTVSDSGNSPRQTQVLVTIVYSYANVHSPGFNDSEYFISVHELEPVGNIVATFTATDLDISLQGQLHYSLSESHFFQVHPASGHLFISSPLDYETNSTVRFTIFAQDSDPNTPLSGSAVVNVNILNANDNTPICNQSTYMFEVPSNAKIDDNIAAISCFDPDGGELRYEATGSIFFGVRNETGQLYVTQQLSSSTIDSVNILVHNNNYSTPVLVIIVINFINIDIPVFSSIIYEFDINEDAAFLTLIGSVEATDSDSANSSLIYNRVDSSGLFYLHPQSGELFLTGILDFERTSRYTIPVFVEDGGSFDGSNSQFGISAVFVSVLDVNDNSPVLSGGGVYSTVTAQSTALGTSILIFSCTDEDDSPYGDPTITGVGFDGSPFALDMLGSQGNITVVGTLTVQDYFFTIVCTDEGGLSVDGQVYVFVPESSAPSFGQSMYQWILNESSPTGSEFPAISATSSNGLITTFSFKDGNGNDMFYIHPITGVVVLLKALDYDVQQTYALVVMATDTSNQQASVLLLVQVINENIEEPFIPGFVSFSVPHNAPVGYPIGVLQCGSSAVGDIAFTTSIDLFGIDSFGIITLEDMLLLTTPVYVLPYTCTSNSASSSTGIVTIEVLFANQYDPIFDYAAYIFSVPESIEVLSTVGTVHASDIDIGSFGEVTYLLSGATSDLFFVEADTGEIKTLSQLDRETRDNYTLIVLAVDGGPAALEASRKISEATVTVLLQDVNDNPPIPNPPIYVQAISSSHSFLAPIISVQFSDQDLSFAGQLIYSINPPMEQFAIQDNGTIILVMEQQNEAVYQFNVIATDGGSPSLAAQASVTIIVDNPEPGTPVFSPEQYQVTVLEDTPLDAVILRVNATTESGEGVVYSIEDGNEGSQFSLDSLSGDFSVVNSINASTQRLFLLTVRATSIGGTPLSSYTTILVDIIDVNENPPTFNSPFYTNIIGEDAALLSPVIQTSCSDPDVDSTITYTIAEQSTTSIFSVINNGLVIVVGELDFEETSVHTLQVTCSDGDHPPATATVTIQVSPVNEYLPVFSQSRYQFSVAENNFGILLGTVEATDQDVGSQGEITYHLQDPGNFSVVFIEPFSGEVVVSNILDYEIQTFWNLTVLARDGAGAESYATIEITVINVNDSEPVVSPTTAISVIPLDSPPNYPVQTYTCINVDGSETRLSILNGNGLNYFNLNSNGQLIWTGVGSNLTSDAIVSLTIQCKNAADTTAQGALAYIAITIRTGDTIAPEFSQNSYSVVITEATPVGTPILSVATTGVSEAVYELFNLPVNFPFSINETTGTISVASSLDHESISLLIFAVRAISISNGASSLALVQVTVEDVNDNFPLIDSPLHPVTLLEDFSLFVPFYSIYCSDIDSGSNGEVSIQVTSENSNPLFNVTSSGLLYLISPLDFEQEETHNLAITCSDGGLVPLSTNTSLLVIVAGVNEFPPVFTNESYSFTVSEDALAGEVIGTVLATDEDRGVGRSLRYELVGGSGESFFTLSTNGDVHLGTRPLDAALNQHVDVVVRVVDSGSLRDETVVSIAIEDRNEPPDIVASDGFFVVTSRDQLSGASILYFSCIDRDTTPNAMLTLSIASNPSALDVYLEETMGLSNLSSNIVINSSLVVGAYQLALLCTDSGNPPLSANVNVTVRVEGENSPPKFQHGIVSRSVSEDTQRGTYIITVNASDPESAVTYDITGGSGLGVFSIDQFTGDITLASLLDYETTTSYNIIITAYDQSRFNPKSASIQAFIFVFNTNDNPPSLVPGGYVQLSVEEGEAPRTITSYSCADIDGGNVFFSIDPPHGPLAPFDISPTGQVQLQGTVDYEVQSSFTLAIRCTDQPIRSADVSQTVEATLFISVISVNMFSPVASLPMDFEVPENIQVGSVIAQVQASDQDQRGLISYTSEIHNFFFLDSSGNITVLQGLDYELTTSYTLRVTANDNDPEATPRSTEFPVSINVTDINDNQPVCSPSILTVNLNIGTYGFVSLANLSCGDNDEGLNARLTYSFLDSNLPRISDGGFTIDNETGKLGFSGTLSIVESLVIRIVVSDAGIVPLTADVIVTIQVVSSVGPRFEPNTFNVNISENIPRQSILLNGSVLRESLRDSAGIDVEYSLVSSDTFRIDHITADLVLSPSTTLDYDEGIREYIAVVLATVGSDMASASVDIHLFDYNDNAPQFEEDFFSSTIFENEPPGTPVFTVQATDIDSGLNRLLAFSIEDNPHFSINSSSGEISSLRTFDREAMDAFSFTVLATDMGTPTRSGQALVTINIGDKNDVAPSFSSSIYTININNVSPPGTELVTLRVVDGDLSSTGSLVFRIITTDTQVRDLFIVDSPGGTLRQTSVKIPDDHQFQYSFTVEVSDGFGTDNTTVVIYIFSVTTASTFFEENTLNETFDVREVLLLQNFDITDDAAYIITNGNEEGVFAISSKGILFNTLELDRESIPVYEVAIQVIYQSSIEPINVLVVVQVTDQNDNAPVFHDTPFSFTVTEGTYQDPVLIGSVNAMDLDEPESANSRIQYNLLDAPDIFTIDVLTGDLYVQGLVDRETRDRHSLRVSVNDFGGPQPLFAYSTVTITVEDVNDNDPVFEPLGVMHFLVEVNDLAAAVDSELNRIFAILSDNTTVPLSAFQYSDRDGNLVISNLITVQGSSKYELVNISINDVQLRNVQRLKIIAPLDKADDGTLLQIVLSDEADETNPVSRNLTIVITEGTGSTIPTNPTLVTPNTGGVNTDSPNFFETDLGIAVIVVICVLILALLFFLFCLCCYCYLHFYKVKDPRR